MADRLLLIRHGETEWSRNGQHTGRTDLDLTPEGEAEAHAAVDALREFTIDAAFTSPLLRARRTAELTGFGDAAILDELMEWDYGAHEGRTTTAIHVDSPGFSKWRTAPPGGESVADVAVRTDAVLTRLGSVDGTVAIFSHGHYLAVLIARWCRFGGEQGERFRLRTGHITVLGSYQDAPIIEFLNRCVI